MSSLNPRFYAGPVRYMRWAARERPAYFWSCIIAAGAPLSFVVAPPLRRLFGDENPPAIPLSYPIPTGPRKQLTGYDDDVNDK
ncbi:n19m, NADH-ubiquinone oxidoreductase 9.5 kDa subunit [Sporothrix curviconia]|uniref:N19m, NADH-ubiquinone oxidoreductase 9.5 kDa subunit n=1 Tax=Sporothrix curviconia TaxID=1260050 RepID=A0ABP0CED5_9PEZI